MTRARSRTRRSFVHTFNHGRFTFLTQPGVFSEGAPDRGSLALLHAVLPQVKPHMTVLDLGTGMGLLGITVAPLLTRGSVWMIDSDIRATRLASENVALNGIENATVLLSDITLDLPGNLRFDLVLSNPPTHSGKEVLANFVTESYQVLRPGGWVYVVVNRLLSVRENITEVFGEAELFERDGGFIVFRAQKPRRCANGH